MRAIYVSIYKPGENLVSGDKELVEIIEYRYPLSPHRNPLRAIILY
jgi:hypothetical protein